MLPNVLALVFSPVLQQLINNPCYFFCVINNVFHQRQVDAVHTCNWTYFMLRSKSLTEASNV